jgi:hypothetical protein
MLLLARRLPSREMIDQMGTTGSMERYEEKGEGEEGRINLKAALKVL